MFLFIFVAVALFCEHIVHGKGINSYAGPYLVYTVRFYMSELPGHPLPWRWNVKTSHFNPHKPQELQLLTGNLTVNKHEINDRGWMKIVMDARSNNAWKENAFVFNFKDKMCSVLRLHIPGFFKLFFGQAARDKSECSVGPGVYEVNQQPIDWTFPYTPVMPYGQYRFRLNAGAGDAELKLASFVVECVVIPKVKKIAP